MDYFVKMKGSGKSPPRTSWSDIGWSWLGAMAGMCAVGWIDAELVEKTDLLMLIGSFAASSVLLYGAPRSPLAQPRNLLGGHFVSALVGVAIRLWVPAPLWMTAALAVATAIAVMHMTRTLHPPGGATAFIAVTGGQRVANLGFEFAFIPAASGALILLVIALAVNNLAKGRRYPEYWW